MTAITQIAWDDNAVAAKLEAISITNQSTNSVAVTKAVQVPMWAQNATIVIGNLTMSGSTPLFDFALYGCDYKAGGGGVPDDGFIYLLAGWAGITQKTSATNQYCTIDVGPNIASDTTGSATASDRYGIQSLLPHWLVYRYTTDGTTDDEDYSANISIYFK